MFLLKVDKKKKEKKDKERENEKEKNALTKEKVQKKRQTPSPTATMNQRSRPETRYGPCGRWDKTRLRPCQSQDCLGNLLNTLAVTKLRHTKVCFISTTQRRQYIDLYVCTERILKHFSLTRCASPVFKTSLFTHI